ncbi:MAG: hypothetical protein ACI3XQ_06710 [Eubacteriales bacterium]
MAKESLEKMIYDETEKRLEEMEQPDYEFPGRIGKADVIGIVAGIVISILLIILCVTGVIV